MGRVPQHTVEMAQWNEVKSVMMEIRLIMMAVTHHVKQNVIKTHHSDRASSASISRGSNQVPLVEPSVQSNDAPSKQHKTTNETLQHIRRINHVHVKMVSIHINTSHVVANQHIHGAITQNEVNV